MRCYVCRVGQAEESDPDGTRHHAVSRSQSTNPTRHLGWESHEYSVPSLIRRVITPVNLFADADTSVVSVYRAMSTGHNSQTEGIAEVMFHAYFLQDAAN